MPNSNQKKAKRSRRQVRRNWYSKSEYARKISRSPTHVNNMIEAGELEVIEYNGGQLIVAPKEKEITECNNF